MYGPLNIKRKIHSLFHEKDRNKNSSHSDIQLWLLFEHYEWTAHGYPTFKLRAHLSNWCCSKNKVHGQQCHSITIPPDNKQMCLCQTGFPKLPPTEAVPVFNYCAKNTCGRLDIRLSTLLNLSQFSTSAMQQPYQILYFQNININSWEVFWMGLEFYHHK